jgi:hypothetical protein
MSLKKLMAEMPSARVESSLAPTRETARWMESTRVEKG